MKYKIILILIGIFLISFASASYIPLFSNPGTSEAGNYIAYEFNWTEYQNCSNVLLSHNEIVSINSRGFGFVQINFSSDTTNYTNIHFLCEYKDSALRKVHNMSSQFFDKLFVKDLYVSNNVNVTGNVTASWFKGLFNWITDDSMLNFDGSTLSLDRLEFNDSVKILFAEEQVVYNATLISTTVGTLDSGNLASVLILADGDTYNVSEVTGSPGFLIYVNFTNIVNFNTVALRGMYDGGAGHTIALEIYRVGVGWEERAEITDQTDWGVTTFPVFIGSDFVDSGTVQLRINHDENGISNHNYFLDAVFIGQVPG